MPDKSSQVQVDLPFHFGEHAELTSEEIKVPFTPQEVLRKLQRTDNLAVLIGDWTERGAIIAWDPLLSPPSDSDPFAIVNQLPTLRGAATPKSVGGGWIGYIGYQSGRLIEDLPASPPPLVPLPRHCLRYYDHLLRFDADSEKWYFEALVTASRARAIYRSRDAMLSRLEAGTSSTPATYNLSRFIAVPGRGEHISAIQKAIDYIWRGDIFQANITLRLQADFAGSPLELFLAGQTKLRPAFGAFLSGSWGAVASLSPELFIRRTNRRVSTSPIKGTAARSPDAVCDQMAKQGLANSEKDRAENLMIVDLMRNDLGRVCMPGTITVDSLFSIQEMAGVWHMVSTVTGILREEVVDGDLLRATFPPGSVTGAPKVRAAEIIDELEGSAREVYTGAIALVSPASGLSSSVVIRTFEIAQAKVWLGVGGGIVADSDPEAEYQECLTKAEPLLEAIGAEMENYLPFRRAGGGQGIVVDESLGIFETIATMDGFAIEAGAHLARLLKSLRSLYGDHQSVTLAEISKAAQCVSTGPGRMRITVRPTHDGVQTLLACEPYQLHDPEIGIATVPVDASAGLGPHKWLDRTQLDELSARHPGLVPLLLAGNTVLEASRSNLFAVISGTVMTPPCDGQILPGITRSRIVALLNSIGVEVQEVEISLERLADAGEVFLSNSLRGVEWVESCLGVAAWRHGPLTRLVRNLLCEYQVGLIDEMRNRASW